MGRNMAEAWAAVCAVTEPVDGVNDHRCPVVHIEGGVDRLPLYFGLEFDEIVANYDEITDEVITTTTLSPEELTPGLTMTLEVVQDNNDDIVETTTASEILEGE